MKIVFENGALTTVQYDDENLSIIDNSIELPTVAYQSLLKGETISLSVQYTKEDTGYIQDLELSYLANVRNIVDLSNNETTYIVGEAVSENKFISLSNFKAIWNLIVARFYKKSQVDEKFNDYYKKAEVYNIAYINTALSKKLDSGTAYTKAETDLVVDNKLKNYYTQSEVDEKLESVEKLDVSNYYTKDEIDDILGDIETKSY